MSLDEREAVTLRDSVSLMDSARHLDESVSEVFGTMLGINCQRAVTPADLQGDPETVAAVVGFAGILSGACILRCSNESAQQIAGLLTGADFDRVDDTVKDAIGEICNMLAGGWKSRFSELSAHCGLSVPAVISGRDYKLHVQSPDLRIHHQYRSASITFEVTILCDRLQ